MPYDPIAKKEYDRKRNAKQKAEYLEKNPDYRNKKPDDVGDKINFGGFDVVLKDYHEKKPKIKIIMKPEFVSPLEKEKPIKEEYDFANSVIMPRIRFIE